MVSLAKRLEGRPFHLIASYCQTHHGKQEMIDYLKSQGLGPSPSNFSVSSQTRHPKVKGNGYVPYYVVFDHRGKIAHHHMCGQYHGGDGLKFIEWVEKLLDDAPSIDVGDAPFEHAAALAGKIREKKNLARSLAKLERELAADRTSEAEKAELTRLRDAVVAWRDRRLKTLRERKEQEPTRALAELEELENDLGRSALGEPAREELAAWKKSVDLAKAIAIEKKVEKIERSLAKLKPCKQCKRDGSETAKDSCATCRKINARRLTSYGKALDDLAEDAAGLGILARIRSLRERAKP